MFLVPLNVGGSMRRLLRRVAPYAVRWRIRALQRAIIDRARGVRFAGKRGDQASYAHVVCRYERPLVCYPGQEAQFADKRRNIALSLAACDGVVVGGGETFSFWRSVGRPDARAGYGAAAALKDGALISEIGGAVCFSSTLLYNAGLLSGMAIVERRCHSVDNYGAARYFELGRDAAVEDPYIDLRLRNDGAEPLSIAAGVEGERAFVEVRSRTALALRVQIEVGAPETPSPRLMRIRGRRTIVRDGVSVSEELPVSLHRTAGG